MKRNILLAIFAFAAMGMTAQNYRNGHDGAYNEHAKMVRQYGGEMPHRDYVYNGYMASCEQVDKVVRLISRSSFDDNKLEIAKVCVSLCPFSVSDLARIARLFSFDENRLEFLKYAYQYCPESEHYYVLRESFTFRSNADKLSRFIVESRGKHYGGGHEHYGGNHGTGGGMVNQGRR